MTLNCTKNGDVRFHPDVAKVTVFGKNDTIGNHFRNAKRDKEGNVTEENNQVAYLDVNGIRVPRELAEQFYVCLWFQCISSNEFLKTNISKYDDYFDGKSEGAINSQAKVFAMYKNGGTKALKEYCSEFLKILKNPTRKDMERESEELAKTSEKEDAVADIVFPKFEDINKYANSVGKKVANDGGQKRDCNNYESILPYGFHVKDMLMDEKIRGYVENLISIYYDYYMKNLTDTYAQRMMHDTKNQYQSFVENLGKGN